MKRREFFTLIGGAAAAWPLCARAQQPAKAPIIGFLGSGTASAGNQWANAFVQRLHELGWIEGQTLSIEYRWADGRSERVAQIAAEFVRLKVAVIVTYANTAAAATKRAVATIPIVFAAAGDPVGTGLVASLARPGGNITGLSIQQTDLASKRLEMLREVLPSLRTVAILANISSPNSVLEWPRLRRRPARSASPWSHQRFEEPRISRPRSTRSRAAQMHFMSVAPRF